MNEITNVDRYENRFAETAHFFREIAFEIDENPDAISHYQYHKVVSDIVKMEYSSSSERVKFYEAASYGDAGAFLACPGPSLSGLMMNELGTKDQCEHFFNYVKKSHAKTFLAVTEPSCGSNLNQLTSRIRKKSAEYQLNSEKWLVGHGATGSIGILLAKLTEGPLGVCAVLITPELLFHHKNYPDCYLKRIALPMTGLRGARLGRLIFKNIPLSKEHILGGHLSAVERGMMALIKTFNRMRPCVGALAIGTAQAMVDYAYHNHAKCNVDEKAMLAQLNLEIALARKFVSIAADHFDHHPFDSEISSLAKIKATQVAEKTAQSVRKILGRNALIKHPWLAKWFRDVYGFEYMEGTQSMQKITIFNAYHKNYS